MIGTKRAKSINVICCLAIFILTSSAVSLFGSVKPEGTGNENVPALHGPTFTTAAPRGLGNRFNPEEEYKEDEILVKYKPGVSKKSKENLHKRHGSEIKKEFTSLRIHHIKIKNGLDVLEAIKKYSQDPDVEYAEPDYGVSILNLPNDPRFNELWGLYNTGQSGGKAGADIRVPLAWDLTTGSGNVVVAVIDTGIDYTHPDLVANMWTNDPERNGMPGVDDDGNGYIDDIYGIDTINHDSNPFDDDGHGTHIAGTIGASGNNGAGVVGVNWNVKMIACKGAYSVSTAIECLEYVRDLKARGVNVVATNNSWGGPSYSQALYDAILAQQDILFIAAAGNSGKKNDLFPFYPANYDLPNIIAVAATDEEDKRTYFSNFGRQTIHVGAPGIHIVSTLPLKNTLGYSDRYGESSGTSMAAPHVTGLAALLKAYYPSADWKEIRNRILSGGQDVASLHTSTLTGKRIDAFGSLICDGLSDSSAVFSPILYPSEFPVDPGQSVVLSALNINCAQPAGPVQVTTSSGQVITLSDDGIYSDLAAGDGTYTGVWTPVAETPYITFSNSSDSIRVPLFLIANYLPEANTHVPYSQFLKALNGNAPLDWSETSGSMPQGFTLNGSTGEISGSPLQAGRFDVSLTVTDSLGRDASGEIPLRVADDYTTELWATDIGGKGLRYPGGITTDDNGYVYLTGTSHSLANDSYGLLTMKMDSSGNLLWSRTFSESGKLWKAQSIAADKSGNSYVAAQRSDYCIDCDFKLLKYDTNGNLVWTRDYDSGYYDAPYAVAVDTNGDILIAGWAMTNGKEAVLTVKYSPSGDVVWASTYDSADTTRGFALTVDDNGNVYVAGESVFEGAGAYQYKYLLLKYNSAGTLLWSRTSTAGTTANAVAVDRSGNVYVAGDGWPAGGIVKYNSAGALLWTKTTYFLERLIRWIDHLTLDANGDVLAIGEYVNGRTAYAMGKFDQSGKFLINKELEGEYYDRAAGIASDKLNNIYVVRTFDNGSGDDFLVSKFRELFRITSTSLPSATAGSAYSQQFKAEGGVLPYSWVITSGSLPPGVTLNSSTGVVSGKPISGGTFNFTLQVTDSANLSAQKGLAISVTAQPDLIVSVVSAPVMSGAGSAITVSDTTTNSGYASAGASSTAFYISANSTWDVGDVLLGSRAVGALAVGASSPSFTSLTIPSGTATGSYYIIAKADPDNLISEISETNNTKASAAIKIGPDLTVTAMTAPTTAGAGSIITVSDTTANIGGGSAASSSTTFYLSNNSTWDSGDVLLGSRAVGALAAGASSPGSTSLTIPSLTATGSYYIIAKADPDGLISEMLKTNNTKASAATKIGSDLTVTALTVPTTGGAGRAIMVTDTTTNIGGVSAASIGISFYLSSNATWDAGDVLLGSRTISALAPGATSKLSTSLTIPSDTATGSYYIIARADPEGLISETLETNNIKVGAAIKIGPDLTVTALTAPAIAGAGISTTVTDTTTNIGGVSAASTGVAFYLSTNTTWDGADVFLGSRAISALAPGAVSKVSTSLAIPLDTATGSYYLIARADPEGLIPETLETNNIKAGAAVKIGPDLTVTALTGPVTSGAGLSITVTDTTANIGGGPAVPSATFFYLSTNTTWDAGDMLLGSRAIDALTQGTNSKVSTTLAIPSDTSSGTYYIIAKADLGSLISETNEVNNTKAGGAVKIGPDLLVSVLTAPLTGVSGGTVAVTEGTKNSGGGGAGGFIVKYYLSANNAFDAGDTLLGSRGVSSVAPSVTNQAVTQLSIPAGTTAGSYFIIAVTDADNAVAETLETNNTKYRAITIN